MSHENMLESFKMKDERYLQVYRGVVRNSFDPDERGRVKVEVLPMMKGIAEEYLPWALPEWNGLLVRIPAEGETVLVRFEGGDVLKPVYWSGTLPVKSIAGTDTTPDAQGSHTAHDYAQHELGDPVYLQEQAESVQEAEDEEKIHDDEPDMAAAPEYPYNSIYLTPGGILIELDDTPDNQRIHVHHPAGTLIEVNADGTIHIRSAKEVHAYSAENVKVYSAKEINVESVEDMTLKSTATLDVEANAVNITSATEINLNGG